jgi:hypothetical protein
MEGGMGGIEWVCFEECTILGPEREGIDKTLARMGLLEWETSLARAWSTWLLFRRACIMKLGYHSEFLNT